MAFDVGPITEEEWVAFRRETTQTLPAHLDGQSIPDILLGYQKELLVSTSQFSLTATDKSRRIGATWAVGADAVLTSGSEAAARGMDTLYIGYNLDMAREFIDTCAMWARAFFPACTEVGEFLFQDVDESGKGDHKFIQAFRIRFASGFEITALSSRPRSLRGRQGYVILDEFAFHDDAPGLLKAATALLIWGGKMLVISTHNGEDNPFNELIKDIRAKKYGDDANVMRATFDDAIEQGLYQRVCLKTGKEWSVEAEAKWREGIRKLYRANAAEELDCVPSQGSGVYLSRVQIERCATEIGPVLQLHLPAGFEAKSKLERESYVAAWLEDYVAPEIAKLDKRLKHFFGHDFARSGHVSALSPCFIDRDLKRRFPFLIEMRNVPHEQQRQVVFYLGENLPRFCGAKMDATGNGSYLAEVTAAKFGESRIEQVMLSRGWYITNMPPFKADVEDGEVSFVKHVDVVDDLRQVRIINGVAQIPDVETQGSDGLVRHADFAVSIVMGHAASFGNASEYAYEAVRPKTVFSEDGRADDDAWDRPYDNHDSDTSIAAQLRGGGTF